LTVYWGIMLSRTLFCLLLLGNFLGCKEQEELAAVCPTTCYSDVSGDTEGVGTCKAGRPLCDDKGNVLSCEGEVLPSHEMCDGLDNDCDGEIDEHVSISPGSPDNQCKQCGRCRGTWERCNMGNWYCDYDEPPALSDDTCDNVDDDCDCQRDEDVRENHEVVFCYTGPENTATLGECRPGVKKCVEGHMFCQGEVLPQPENCNQRDNDCNGMVDDVLSSYTGNDIIFGIDVSGSMGQYISIIAEVVCQYSQATQADASLSVQIGLVTIAQPDTSYELALDLTDAQTFCEALQDLEHPGSYEPTISAANAVVNPSNPLGISWREGTKRTFIGFGDEIAQSSSCFEHWCSLEEEINQSILYCNMSDTNVYWFVEEDFSRYAAQASGCGGDVFGLSPYAEAMRRDLNDILDDACAVSP